MEGDTLNDTNHLVSNDETMVNVVTYVIGSENDRPTFHDVENDIQSDLDVINSFIHSSSFQNFMKKMI